MDAKKWSNRLEWMLSLSKYTKGSLEFCGQKSNDWTKEWLSLNKTSNENTVVKRCWVALKASEQKRPAFAGRILCLSFMFCEIKGMNERRPISVRRVSRIDYCWTVDYNEFIDYWFNRVCCYLFPNSTCVTGNGWVWSSDDNKLILLRRWISWRISLLRTWERMVWITDVNRW